MKLKHWTIYLLLLGLLLSSCASAIPTTQEIPNVDEVLPPQVAGEIQNQVSEMLGVSLEDIQIEKVEQMDWPNSCLGLPEEGEACTDVITPGWLVIYSINGQEFRYRVNDTGTVIRQEAK